MEKEVFGTQCAEVRFGVAQIGGPATIRPVKRTLAAALLVLMAGAAAAAAYAAAARDREYQRLLARGEAALASQQVGIAVEAFSGAIALKPDAMVAYLKRGDAYQRHGDLKAALRDLRAASVLDPTATRPIEQLGDVNVALGRFDRAADRYQAYVAIDDRSPRVLYKLALAQYDGGQAQAAIAPLRRALALDENFAEAHYLLGLCLEARGQRRAALGALERAVAIAPSLLEAREALAAAHRAAGRHGEAARQLEAIAALDRRRPMRLIAVGMEYADAGRTDLAVTTLVRAAERFPTSVDVYSALGEVWLRAAESQDDRVALGKAIEALRTAVVRGGSGARELALYGRALLQAGQTKEALRALREAGGKLPVAPDTLLDLSHAAERAGRLREARDALLQYTTLLAGGPAPAAVTARIGQLSWRVRDTPTAVVWLRRAAAQTTDAALLADLTEAELAAGNRTSARTAIARALGIAPGSARLLRLQARIGRP